MDTKEILIQLAKQIRDERELGANTATRVGSLFLAMVEFMGDGEFLHKDEEDVTKFLLECLGGLTVEKGLKADSLEVEGVSTLGGRVTANGLVTGNEGLIGKSAIPTEDDVCSGITETVEDTESDEVGTGLTEEISEYTGSSTIGGLLNVSSGADTAPNGTVLVMQNGTYVPEIHSIKLNLNATASELWNLLIANPNKNFFGYIDSLIFDLAVSWPESGKKVKIIYNTDMEVNILTLEKSSDSVVRTDEYIQYITLN